MQVLLIPIQIVLLVFILFAFSRAWLRFRERTINIGTFLFWSSIWGLATIGILNPQLTTRIAKTVGIGRGADVVIYASLVLLFYLVYRTNVLLENLRHELTELVRKIALQKEKRSKRSNGHGL